MLSIGIVDDGVGFIPTLCKLRQAVGGEYVCVVCPEHMPLGERTPSQLAEIGTRAVRLLEGMGCNAVVLSSVALSSRRSVLSAGIDIYGCDAPVMHGLTYTASGVLLTGDECVLRHRVQSGLIPLPMPEFPRLAEEGDERRIVEYISRMCEPIPDRFDCIVLANSSMNLYKHCFARVYPGVKIFDSPEGVARRMRKAYKKYPREEGGYRVVDLEGRDISEKYTIFSE